MTTYQRLGDYIREVNVRNLDLKVTKPMGINIDKHFMPSVANVIGTDLSTYKIVSRMQFACNLMHVGRDEKIPMALLTGDKPIIVSPAYFVFEVIESNVLLPSIRCSGKKKCAYLHRQAHSETNLLTTSLFSLKHSNHYVIQLPKILTCYRQVIA